jgi:PAS domain S-box-containing protein
MSRKLMVAFAAVLAIICVSSAVLYDRLSVIEQATNWRVHTTDVLDTLEAATDGIQDQVAGLRHYFITHSENALEPYYRGSDAFTATVRKLKELTADNPTQQSRLDELDELAKKWRSDFAEREIALLSRPDTRENARALEASIAGKSVMDLIRAKLEEIAAVERDLLAKRDAAQNQAYAVAYAVTMVAGAASLLVAILMGLLLTRGITIPITRMTNAMAALAKGDTSVTVPEVARSDEIGAMAAAVQVFKDNMIERQRVEAELARRDAKIRRLVDANIIGIFMFALEGQIIEANDAFLRMLGYQRDDLVSGRLRWTDLTPPEWLERDERDLMPELQKTGTLPPFEKEYLRKDGSRVPVVLGVASFEANGEGVAFVLDLTERKRAEEALRDSEEKWRAVFENNPTMYFMVDAGGTILSVNPFGAEQLGYTVDELTGGSVLKVFHESDRADAQRNTARCLEQLGQALSWELRKLRKDGSMLWVRETARAMLMKGRPVVLIVCEDITERRRAENLTARVFESAPEGICIVERHYRYRRANPAYARRWAVPAERILGMQVSEVLGSDNFERILKPNLDRCFAGEEVNFEWVCESRGRRYFAVSYSPLRSGSGKVEAALVIQRDLTEYMRASEALQAAQAELAHVNRVTTMGQLTASIGHEINQPIAATVTNAHAALRWLSSQPPDLHEVRQALGRIVNDGNRASDVIGRIRALIRKAPPRKDRFDINQAVLDVITLTQHEVLRHRVSLQTQLAPGLPRVEGDRIQLQQVIMNFILNAIEAMSDIDEGTRELWISTEMDAASALSVAVRDSGPGLDPANVERVFEAFYTTKPNGMGMGLAICRSIVETHGGKMWAGANEPRGAVFQFTLPLERDDSGPIEHTDPMLAA